MLSDEANQGSSRKLGIRLLNEQLILEAAEEVFATFGYQGSSTSLIAEKAGVPKANVYHYFGTKKVLYQRVLDRTHQWWGEAARAFDDYAEPADALTRYIHRKMDMARENYHGSKVWAGEVMQGAPLLQGYLETEVRGWMRSRIAVVEGWIAAGKMRPVEPFYLLLLIWATTQHYADFEHQIATLNGGKPLTNEQHERAKETVTGIVLRGIGVEPPAGQAASGEGAA